MVPYTADRCTNWGGYHCPETSLGFIAGCAIHELGLAQWGNKSDHTSPVRYEGTGSVPQEGIFRTLATWDVNCDYENGVKMRLMEVSTAERSSRACRNSAANITSSAMTASSSWAPRAGSPMPRASAPRPRNLANQIQGRRRGFRPVHRARPQFHRLRPIPQGNHVPGGNGDPHGHHLPPRQRRRHPQATHHLGSREGGNHRRCGGHQMLSRPFREKWKIW